MKYIIDVPNNTQWIQWMNVSEKDGSAYFDYKAPEDLTPYVRSESYIDGLKKGQNEVWEFASMLMNMHHDVAEDIYWSMNGGKGIEVAAEMTYQEAKAKYDAWKKKKDKICVGDEVEYECDGIVRFVVFGIVGNTAYGFKYPCDYDDVGEYCDIDMLTKTGRHFSEVEKLVEKMSCRSISF